MPRVYSSSYFFQICRKYYPAWYRDWLPERPAMWLRRFWNAKELTWTSCKWEEAESLYSLSCLSALIPPWWCLLELIQRSPTCHTESSWAVTHWASPLLLEMTTIKGVHCLAELHIFLCICLCVSLSLPRVCIHPWGNILPWFWSETQFLEKLVINHCQEQWPSTRLLV